MTTSQEEAQWRERVEKLADRFTDQIDKRSTPMRDEAWSALSLAAQWAQLGMRFGFIMNSGALLYVAHLVVEKSKHNIQAPDIATAAWAFAAGIVAAALCVFSAYLNYGFVATQRFAIADTLAWNALANTTIDQTIANENREKAHKAEGIRYRQEMWINITSGAGILLGISTFALLIYGVSALIPGALNSLLPPKP